MIAIAALVTAIAALVAAIAWPIAFLVIFFMFRGPLSAAFEKLPSAISRMQKLKLGSFEAELEAEAKGLIEQAVAEPGTISPEQIRSAARIQIAAKGLDQQSLRDQVQQLCIEYETIRKVLPSSRERTRAMTDVLVRMRTLAPSAINFLDELKRSPSSGNRLTAIAIMQVDPGKLDYQWILDRFRSDEPFAFFHAAVALRNAALVGDKDGREAAADTAQEAIEIIESFEGLPDRNTLTVLNGIVEGKPGDTRPPP
ncbi:MAG: hypothetical protein H7X93_07575 [Sphingomonadaceae bacterium]|nr:hypothetical protein [Sphingomonadaceae bacterium]